MRLFIAEKPSLARLIVSSLGPKKGKHDGYYETDTALVTWCFGHMLEQLNPEDYWPEEKKWRLETLPLIPEKWSNKPVKDKKKQVNIIKSLINDKRVTEIVHCGDADREGQLLIDEVLIYFNNKKPVVRFWLHAQDDKGVKRAFEEMKSNKDYEPLLNEAIGRQRADWLIGMNLTRAVTITKAGPKELMTIGRVQTPTLALVVNREKEIKHFVPKDYFNIVGTFDYNGEQFKATLTPGKDLDLDEEGRIVDLKIAESIKQTILSKPDSSVLNFKEEKSKEAPPLPHKLSSLQKIVSRISQCSAQDVLKAVQSLYEAAAVSYPRTDCQYLPDSQFNDAPKIIPVAAAAIGLNVSDSVIDYTRRSRAFNEAKVVSHYGLVPTGTRPSFSNGLQEIIYDLISRYFIAQFCEHAEDQHRSVSVSNGDYVFKATGKMQISPGWRVVIRNDKEKITKHTIPIMKNGDALRCIGIAIESKQTQPPSRFTESTLLDAMENIHRYVLDQAIKLKLKETSGIGTQATRGNIIENLIGRGYINNGKGKQKQTLFPSDSGIRLISAAPVEIIDPGFTGLFEKVLTDVGAGNSSLDNFMGKQSVFLTRMLNQFTAVSP